MKIVEKIKIRGRDFTATAEGKLEHKQGVARLVKLQNADGKVVYQRLDSQN